MCLAQPCKACLARYTRTGKAERQGKARLFRYARLGKARQVKEDRQGYAREVRADRQGKEWQIVERGNAEARPS
jgi:hypothetical protein